MAAFERSASASATALATGLAPPDGVHELLHAAGPGAACRSAISPTWNVAAPILRRSSRTIRGWRASGRSIGDREKHPRQRRHLPHCRRGPDNIPRPRLDVRPICVAIDNWGCFRPAGRTRCTGRPSVSQMLTNRDSDDGGTIGRLRPGATIAQARDDMRIDFRRPATNGSASRGTIRHHRTRGACAAAARRRRRITRFLVLRMQRRRRCALDPCANVAGLQLARGGSARPEMELSARWAPAADAWVVN